ncbi:helicase associated domain-containing protein [Kitasatospora viridis]|uniref:Helicase-associated domain-containing protein n=1 Tax=Kitasatospora viridis TaxID=281105 RepID=A0A561SA38_9ACTN|nr:helicase associated domain-containing protein [Kitasatospora viridis]TWF71743.1 hypothetical protein FHX73_18114 [Kitasatospora viridis]
MTTTAPAPDILKTLDNTPGLVNDLTRVIRHLVDHDGRLPEDSDPLAWWLTDLWERPQDDPLRAAVASIPILPNKPSTPRRAHEWGTRLHWLHNLDRWLAHNGPEPRHPHVIDTFCQGLGKWINQICVQHWSGRLSLAEEILLRSRPGWTFDQELTRKGNRAADTGEGLRLITDFVRTHGHSNVPDGTAVNGFRLDRWWADTRASIAQGSARPQVVQRLEALKAKGADLRSDAEQRRSFAEQRRVQAVQAIATFVGFNQHCNIPYDATTPTGFTYGRTVSSWRGEYAQGKLDPAIRAAVEAIDGWEWVRPELVALEVYARTWGHIDVPVDYVTEDGLLLGEQIEKLRSRRWVRRLGNGGNQVKKYLDRAAAVGWQTGIDAVTDTLQALWDDAEPPVLEGGFKVQDFAAYCRNSASRGLLTASQLDDYQNATKIILASREEQLKIFRANTDELFHYLEESDDHVPAWDHRSPTGLPYARWIRVIRTDHWAGRLPWPHEKYLLNSVPDWSWHNDTRVFRNDNPLRPEDFD